MIKDKNKIEVGDDVVVFLPNYVDEGLRGNVLQMPQANDLLVIQNTYYDRTSESMKLGSIYYIQSFFYMKLLQKKKTV